MFIGDVARALFALQQPLDLAEIAAGVREGRLPMVDSHTPDWFAAAASSRASLLDMAPELRAAIDDVEVEQPGVDLVRMYAGELAALDEPQGPLAPPDAAPAVQVSMLRELADLDE